MKCKNKYCHKKARDDGHIQWYYCNECLRENARAEMAKRPDLFK